MQVNPPAAVAPPTPWPSLNPGPVVLLLLLPSIPLLLFGVGARPPNLNHLPFSTGDVYATGALLTCAIAVVLGMAVWPEGLAGVWNWVKGDRGDVVDRGALLPRGPGHGSGSARPRPPDRRYIRQQTPFASREQWLTARRVPSPLPPPRLDTPTALRIAFRPWYDPSRPHLVSALFVMVSTLAMLLLAFGHALGVAYDADIPPSRTSHSSGHGNTKSTKSSAPLDAESGAKRKDKTKKKGSEHGGGGGGDWVQRELSKRREERTDPAKTKLRVAQESARERANVESRKSLMTSPAEFEAWRKGEEAKRQKEMDALRALLEKEKLPLVALDPPAAGKEESASKLKDPTSRDGVGSRVDPSRQARRGADVRHGDEPGQGQGQGWWGNKIKRMFVGNALAQGLASTTSDSSSKKKKAREQGSNGTATASASGRADVMVDPKAKKARGTVNANANARGFESGPAWEPASQAVVDATLMQSAANAESNAARLKAEMKQHTTL